MAQKSTLLLRVRPRAANRGVAEGCLLTNSCSLHKQPMSGIASRFIELAQPNLSTGVSDWVNFADHPELHSSNGSGWSRGDVVRNKDQSWRVEKQRANGQATGKIVAMRCLGLTAASEDRSVPSEVRRALRGKACVLTGAKSTVEVDHKNGRYNAPSLTLTDFQPLCRTSNIVKRTACAQCKPTGIRFDATTLGHALPWLEGGEEFGDGDPEDTTGCRGCFYHDIARFVEESPFEFASANESTPGDGTEVITDAPGRIRSIQYLGAKTKLLPSLLHSFDEVRAMPAFASE